MYMIHTLKHTDTPIPHVVLPLRPHHNIHVHVPYAHMSHHLHLILLYSPQHLLPTSSALHHDDPADWPHTTESYCPGKGVKEQTKSNIQIHITTSMYIDMGLEGAEEWKDVTQPARYMNQWQICIGSLIQTKIVWFTTHKRLMNVVKKWVIHFPK